MEAGTGSLRDLNLQPEWLNLLMGEIRVFLGKGNLPIRVTCFNSPCCLGEKKSSEKWIKQF